MFSVRQIEQKDLKDLEELYISSIRANEKGFIQDLSRSKNIKDFVVDVQKNLGNFYGVFANEKLIGFGGYINENDDKIQICKVHLHKDFQSCGLGRLLLSSLESDAKYRGYKDFVLHVTNTQKAAISLYKKMGYQIDGEADYKITIDNKEYIYPTIYMSKTVG